MPDLTISDAAINLIISAEVTSESVYTKRYQHPTWPGGRSGVTIGIGYDCGYVTGAQLLDDWGGLLEPGMVGALVNRAVGVKGDAAEDRARELHDAVTVPWRAATAEFRRVEIKRWIAEVAAALPHTDRLHPDCLGALVSLAYNRGASFSSRGERYSEMRSIKAHMASGELSRIPADLRSMIRLWPRMKGLRIRREDEARLFEHGLKQI